jgi:hypothetical protein
MQEFWWYGANTRGKGHNAASTEAGQGALTSAALRRRLRSMDPKISGRPAGEGGRERRHGFNLCGNTMGVGKTSECLSVSPPLK